MRDTQKIKSEIEEVISVLESGLNPDGSEIGLNDQIILLEKLERLQIELRNEKA